MHIHVYELAYACKLSVDKGRHDASDREVARRLVCLIASARYRRERMVVVAATPHGATKGQGRKISVGVVAI